MKKNVIKLVQSISLDFRLGNKFNLESNRTQLNGAVGTLSYS